MSLKRRLNRLEAALGAAKPYISVWDLLFNGMPVPDGFDPARDLHSQHLPVWNAFVALPNWLEENGYKNALEALEAGETGPEGLRDLLQEQARYDKKHRAWKPTEDAQAAGKLPATSDTRLFANDE